MPICTKRKKEKSGKRSTDGVEVVRYSCLCQAVVAVGQSRSAQEDEKRSKEEATRRPDREVKERQQEAELARHR